MCTKCRAQAQHHLHSVHAPFVFLLHLCFELRVCCPCLRTHPELYALVHVLQHLATTAQAKTSLAGVQSGAHASEHLC